MSILNYDTQTRRWSLWVGRRCQREFGSPQALREWLEEQGIDLVAVHADDLLAHFDCGFQEVTG